MFHLVGQIPKHKYVFVKSEFVSGQGGSCIPAVWFGLVSHPGRAWGLTVMLECGAVYRNLPPHAISFSEIATTNTACDCQLWDCYGYQFSVLEYDYLSGLVCRVKFNNVDLTGRYLFSVAPVGDGFSDNPSQMKEFYFIECHNGSLAIAPNNHCVFTEKSFTGDKREFPKGIIRQDTIYTIESCSKYDPKFGWTSTRKDCERE